MIKLTSKPNYYKVGNGTMNKHNIQSIDFIEELIECSKPAQTVVKWIKKGMTWDRYGDEIIFIVQVLPSSPADKQTLIKGFKELNDKGLVRRVKRSHYMINPHAIITDFNKQLIVWNELSSN